MRFKDLTSKQISYAKEVYYNKDLSWDERMGILQKLFEKCERTTRKWLITLGIVTNQKKDSEDSEQYEEAKKKTHDKTKKRFLITWAQNNTPVHKPFFDNMKAYAEFIDADIHVIAGRYKNPTSVFSDYAHDYWVDDVLPFLDANRHDIHKYVSVMSDVKIQPTAVNPLSGLEGMSGINSCVFGSPRVHLKVIAAMEGHKPKIMMTTGSVTKKNYTDSKVGKKGEFHHTLGFVIVEISSEDKFFARQVTAKQNGSFCDLIFEVKDGDVEEIDRVAAAVLGDIHLHNIDKDVIDTTVDFLDRIKPKHTILHDLFDGWSISHWHTKNPIKLYQKQLDGSDSLKKEISQMVDWLEDMRRYNLVIVRSNHDDFVDRWVVNSDWKKNIINSVEYMEYAKVLLQGEAPNGIIPYVINKNFNDIKTLSRTDSYIVKGWELGAHGDYGQNGSRGSIGQFRRLNTKVVTAHSHTPARQDGALTVGTTTKLKMDYNEGGPSTWLHSHVIIHESGKAQHIIIIGGEFTTLI